MSRTIGYVRVSTVDQDPALQRNALADIGVTEIFSDTTSGASAKRPGLKNALAALKKGDTLIVWRLDRLGRSMRQLVDTADEIQNKGAHLKSVTETIDTATAGGRVLFHVLGALAEFERESIRERVVAGMMAAKRDGRHVGRPQLMTPDRVALAREQLTQGRSWAEVARLFSISPSTLSRALQRHLSSG